MTYDFIRVNVVVVLVITIFCFEFTVVVLGVIIPWLSFSVPGVLNLAAITLSTFMGLYCYLLCVLSDSGKVPDDYQHDPEDHVAFQVQVKRKGGAARWCSKCNKPKPPRTHHCRVCERCVARMDHHCPWINNCVGHGNYKAFLLCLFYTETALLHAMGLFCMHALHLMAAKSSQRVVRVGPEGLPTTLSNMSRFDDGAKHFMLWAVLQTAGLALTFPLAIGVGVLLGWHVYIVSSNKTTIEYHEGVTASAHFRAFGQRYDHPYNIGLLSNINAVLGHNALCWLVPGISAAGDGIVFPTNLAGVVTGSVLAKTKSSMS